jgi:hypothetical protein
MIEVKQWEYIEFDYVNWKGKKGHRKARVLGFFFGTTEFHKEEQWLMQASDLDKKEERTFAMRDMSNIKYW